MKVPAQWTIPTVIVVLFLATLIRSAFGFGEALIAVPLLALVMPVKQAAPLAVLVSTTIAFVILLQDWRLIHLGSAWRLILSTMPGIPAGLLLLQTAPEVFVKALLGTIILTFAAYSLTSSRKNEMHNDRRAWVFGLSAGVLGGAYGMNGPPLAIYGALRRWSPEHFRATLQAYFLPASAAAMLGYYAAGLWTPTVNHLYAVSLPSVLLASLLGRGLNRRMNKAAFTSYIYVGLAIIGAILLLQTLIGGRSLPNR